MNLTQKLINNTKIMDRQKLIHQLFIGKVADVLGMEKTTELLKEAKEAFAIPNVVQQSKQFKCDNGCDWYSVGHQLNGHQQCRTCGKQKAF